MVLTSSDSTFRVLCAHCGDSVLLRISPALAPRVGSVYQAWVCPRCQRSNVGQFEGQLAGAPRMAGRGEHGRR